MVVALVLLGVALAISLYFNLFGRPASVGGGSFEEGSKLESEVKARKDAESAVEKKNKDLEVLKVQVNELKDELKTAKKKLHEQRESEKDSRDLKKAREETERSASIQLENVRAELATALAEVERLRADQGAGGRSRQRPQPSASEAQPLQQQPAAAPPPQRESVQRVIRELSEADKEKMTRLETEAKQARGKLAELEKEMRRTKGRLETQNRVYVVTKSELDLVKDKFRALEKRLNRTLLERDIVKRAIGDLEKKTGVAAERTELSAAEVAASDKSVEEKQAREVAEEKAREAERVAKEKAAEAAAAAAPTEPPANGASAEAQGTQTPATPTTQPS